MRNDSGFTIIEAMVAIVILGLIATFALMPRQNVDQFRRNVAMHLVDELIETARGTPFTNLQNANDNVVVLTRGQNVTYNRTITVVGWNVDVVNNGQTYELTNILSTQRPWPNANIDNSHVKEVTVQVRVGGGTPLAARTILIPNPNP